MVRAPIDGRAGAVRVTPGNIVRPSDGGEGLVTITQMKPLRVTFTLPERDLAALRAADAGGGVPVRVFVHGEPQAARRRAASTSSTAASTRLPGTITVKATVANQDGALWPGQYVDVEVDLGKARDAVTVPLVAIQPGQDGPFVYASSADGKAAIRKVVSGETIGDEVDRGGGLDAGDHVVTEGQLRLRSGSRVTERRCPPRRRGGGRSGLVNVSALFIRRPVATILLSVALTLGGMFAYGQLPVAALPQVDFPTVTVSAQLPGASPDTMATAVATPLIKQFSTIPAIQQISTTSSQGATSITVEFELGRDIDAGGGRRPGGDRPHPAPAADRDDHPAELPQAQPGRRADPAAGAAERHHPAARARRVRPAGDLAGPVDHRRRRSGADLRQPEICRAHPARPRPAGRARHRRRRDREGGGRRQRQHAGRHRSGRRARS